MGDQAQGGKVRFILIILMGTACFGRLPGGKDGGDRNGVSCPDDVAVEGEDAAQLSASAVLYGEENTLAGFAVASAGAHNTDDYGDMLVGAPGYDPEVITRVPSDGDVTGVAYLLHGPLAGETAVGVANVVFTGEAVGDGAGMSLVAADLNKDGYQDAVIGAPFGQLAGTQSGLAYVAYGPHAGVTLLETSQRVAGEAHGDWFGWQVATADMNADDRVDLLVGAPHAGTNSAGTVTVGTGGDGGIVSDVHTVGAFRVVGEANDMFGFALATGDMNGDGVDDIVGSAPRTGDGGDSTGVVYIVHGPLTDDAFAVDGEALTYGVQGDGFGRTVVLGDGNGDGSNDVFVGAPSDDARAPDAGAVYAFSSGVQTASEPFLTIVGAAYGDSAGESVALLDGNGDRTQDVAVGAPFADAEGVADVGKAYMVYGPAEGCVELGDAYASTSGTRYGDRLGKRVASIGDTDNDGMDDLAVASPYASLTGARSGYVYLFTGE